MDYADPPGMPDDERMTDAELRVVREHLGLTGDALAAHLACPAGPSATGSMANTRSRTGPARR